jgi:transposase InsO family protein
MPPPGLTDRGVQYASGPCQAILARHGLRCSMSRRGNCLDNAPMESFFGSLKTELVHRTTFPTRVAARRAIFEYVESFYNRRCRQLRPRLLDPGPGLRADGQGRVTRLTPPSMLTGEAQLP